MRNAIRVVTRASLCCSRAGQRLTPASLQCKHAVQGTRALSLARPRTFSSFKRAYSTELAPAAKETGTSYESTNDVIAKTKQLPPYCPGCGAPSQTIASDEAGYFTLTRSAVKGYLNLDQKAEDRAYEAAIKSSSPETLKELGLDETDRQDAAPKNPPICDRCHNLIHHHAGVPIYHPSIESIQQIIEESPYKHNHIYHVVDAADFPMSLIPSLQHDLRLPRLRTQNRRSKTQRFVRGRVAEVSFIITRSDLLAPKEEQVDRLMPYLREVLRDSLGQSRKNVRLGNVRCVSAKRGWWTKDVKEEIWKRGGAGWMVGKVNVGKSNLFEVVFPKGRGQGVNIQKMKHDAGRNAGPAAAVATPDGQGIAQASLDEHAEKAEVASLSDLPGEIALENPETALVSGESTMTTAENTDGVDKDETAETEKDEDPFLDEDEDASLLPPAQIETAYPVMPIVSFLPGTTASPIRIPFGNGKGELIDLSLIHI